MNGGPARSEPWPEGVPCWVELATPDLDAATAFYAAVLGWEVAADGLARHRGRDVARLRPADDGTAIWTLYFAVDDVDDARARVEELGGAVLDADDGAFLALDLGGAEFGGWECAGPDGHVGAGARGEPGTLVGADAASADPGQARTFYAALFGFRDDAGTLHHPDDGPVGTLGIAGDALPHWLVRFGVADLDAALAVATGAGASVVSVAEGPDEPRGAVLLDPTGARVGLTEIISLGS